MKVSPSIKEEITQEPFLACKMDILDSIYERVATAQHINDHDHHVNDNDDDDVAGDDSHLATAVFSSQLKQPKVGDALKCAQLARIRQGSV